ncbi:crotonase/enoyl-CoA hydratase family protein [Rhodobacter sp. NTK016B]|uniref:crotonase/enoyl-CoA hydratase family protein n=1 Tax=Rhodobacterales TaxID=204455 RepID=UPI001A8DF2D1|nr:crotonase/enoyl-CoA hydratase family protein [Rhodobacter sp. NTK016B]MBN8293956.1 crotonase/enoyl-CoA hydratase family protein [Rhodobacter sp. NTK016B]
MDYLTLEFTGDVGIVGLNRPSKRNAISDAFIEELDDVITQVEAKAKAGVIHGHGPHFCAGLDLAEHVKKSPFEGVQGSRRWHQVFARLQRGKLPWFAALHGAVVGGGLELASSVHVRVADKTAFFALPEGQRGIFVGGGASARTARLMGVSRMMDLMMTGRSIDADTAERWGTVNYVVDEGAALDEAVKMAAKAATNAELSNYAIIHALPRINDMATDDGLWVESLIASFTQTSPEAEARLNAFLEKRVGKVSNPNA